QRQVVLDGLKNKLGLYKRKKILSYKYEVCPICKEVKNDCNKCYIPKSCKAPFNDGFRDDLKAGVAYFTEMQGILFKTIPPSVFVAGGTWDSVGGRPSKIIEVLADELQASVINGGNVNKSIHNSEKFCKENDLIIWMPNISNEEIKIYPRKSQGSVLICSKVMREGYTKADSVTRIFRMHANAVIEIRKKKDHFNFRLVDALGNSWVNTDSISNLTKAILALYKWTKESIRVGTVCADKDTKELASLIDCTCYVANKVESSIGERYFGNVLTRCQKMFPGMRDTGETALVSPRNSDKRRLKVEDMVLVVTAGESIQYWGSRKPSVDTPIQLAILANNFQINFLIHGHAYVEGAPITKHYYPCGDMREVPEIIKFTEKSANGVINLKNHGFLMFSNTIKDMMNITQSAKFIEPQNF
ncbi:hypothetical protein LCGC14_0762480, partial [marine sediment metagenome]